MKKIILAPNPYRDKTFQTVRSAKKILKDSGFEVRICLPFEVEKPYELPRDIFLSKLERELPDAYMVICFGGDGTILHMAKAVTKYDIPILGVNIGTMGFMAELESTELSMLSRLAYEDFVVDNRMMLDVSVYRGRDILYHSVALNDAVITKGAVARIVPLTVKCDDVEALQFGGDGVVVSTPTGSTAYNLSAGGPLVEPDSSNILVTPICAHNLSARGFVATDKRVISVSLTENARRNAYLSVDGGKAFRLNVGDVTVIKKSQRITRLVRLKERSFYDVVSTKFHNN